MSETEAVCKGSLLLGTACQRCLRCRAERAALIGQRQDLADAETLILKIRKSVIEPTHPNWADQTNTRRSRFDIADWCSAWIWKRQEAK